VLPKEWRNPRNSFVETIIVDISRGITTRGNVSNLCLHVAYVSQIEPKDVKEALKDENGS